MVCTRKVYVEKAKNIPKGCLGVGRMIAGDVKINTDNISTLVLYHGEYLLGLILDLFIPKFT